MKIDAQSVGLRAPVHGGSSGGSAAEVAADAAFGALGSDLRRSNSATAAALSGCVRCRFKPT